MDDLHIRNGFVVDGTGAPGRPADIAVSDGVITAVGDVDGTARRTVDADGALVTPGFVDIHTHFDGQVCWDKQVTPSSWHGVTTVVMGNCGVGFAPVRPGTEAELVALMEAVEDIPGTALHEGIPWGWESFGEYLDAIDTPYSVDVGAQIPHVALRYYVMGDRCYDDATADDIARMAELSRGALADGALGFSTSRFYGHRNKQGQVVPGTHASADEMVAIAEALRDGGHGTMEIISDHMDEPAELAWIEAIARIIGRPITLLVGDPVGTSIWQLAGRLAAEGLEIRPQVGARPASVLMTLEGTLNPLRQFPTLLRDQGPADRRAEGGAARPGVPGPAPRRRAQGPPLRRHERDPVDVAPDVRAARRPQLRADVRRLARRHRRGARRRRARGADGRDGRRPPDPVPVRRLPRATSTARSRRSSTRSRCSACPTAAPTAACSATPASRRTCSPT